MPELPEVHNVCLSLAPRVLGRRIVEVVLRRAGVVHGQATPAALLEGQTLGAIHRHGKHLALIGYRAGEPGAPAGAMEPGPPDQSWHWRADAGSPAGCLDIHLGMTGSLCHGASPPDYYVARAAVGASPGAKSSHIHVAWRLDDGSWLQFRDPRRFGGIWTFPSLQELRARRWHALGEDALNITPVHLAQQLARTHRPIKAALLDQGVVAGLGNIYVDELLFACGLHPLTPTDAVPPTMARPLVQAIHRILRRAIAAGGSSTRDYVNGEGQAGWFQRQHKVYGRGGLPCRKCQTDLRTILVAGRTSAYCPSCQPGKRWATKRRRVSKRIGAKQLV